MVETCAVVVDIFVTAVENATMADPSEPPPVKLICGIITARKDLYDEILGLLEDSLAPVELQSGWMDFEMTDYYSERMGRPLFRRFVGFAGVASPGVLCDAKMRTNAIEARLSRRHAGQGPPRCVNLDPGYVEYSKLVLASMKNFSHRIYLRDGVYAEVTMQYRGNRWRALEWTFPDYASGSYDEFLTRVRDALKDHAGRDNPPPDRKEPGE